MKINGSKRKPHFPPSLLSRGVMVKKPGVCLRGIIRIMMFGYRVFIPDRNDRAIFSDDPAFNMLTAKRALSLISISVNHDFSSHEVYEIS